MSINPTLYKSNKMDWETPQYLFDKLDAEFHFTLDVCANSTNHKCTNYLSPEQDGLNTPWGNNICWMNPPYGKQIKHWIKKAYEESTTGSTAVCLVPSRTDTEWWHSYAIKAKEIRFIKGRIKFVGATSSAPFPSCILIFTK